MKVKLLAITPNAERLVEFAARTCYHSTDKAQPGSAAQLLPRLIVQGHESPLEHAYATFHLAGVSRAMTHQLVRHRLLAVSQQSQRYVAERNFDYIVPPSVAAGDRAEYQADMAAIQGMYNKWKDRKLRNEDARFVLPNACATELVISANFREFRHIFKVRLAPQAQWEIRAVCACMLQELLRHAPVLFDDLRGLLPAEDPAGA